MTPGELAVLMEATWPPARTGRDGAFTLREGEGGGKRVSAATCEGEWDEAGLLRMESAMAEPLVLIRPGDEGLDAALEARGWSVVDPIIAYAAPVDQLATELPPLTAFAHWPPLEIARLIWAEGGIGPARLRVMDRAQGPKSAVLARQEDRPAGAGFVACRGGDAMLHALEVRTGLRRKGTGEALIRAAATWAAEQGARRLALVVTKRNAAARSVYDRLGMQVVGQYHYRVK